MGPSYEFGEVTTLDESLTSVAVRGARSRECKYTWRFGVEVGDGGKDTGKSSGGLRVGVGMGKVEVESGSEG